MRSTSPILLVPLLAFHARAGTQDEEAQVRAHVEMLTSTWNTHDMKAFAQDSTLTSTVAAVKWLRPDVALAQLSWQTF
jgi:hypothetical protein